MIKKLFLDHPASVGESYGEHAAFASAFGWRMFTGSLACFVHALVPALCQTTGSRAVLGLHETLLEARAKIVEKQRAEAEKSAEPAAR